MLQAERATIDPMHEGNKIKELLKAANKSQSDLARAADVTPSAVQRYVAAETLGAHAWETAAKGLRALGIDPQVVRPSVTMHREKPAADLRGMLSQFTSKQLPILLQLLRASDGDRRVLDAVIEDRIERDSKH